MSGELGHLFAWQVGRGETGLVESVDCIIMQTSAGGGQTLGSQATSAGKI